MTPQPHDSSDLNALFGELCNEALDAPGKQGLNDVLANNPEAQKQYILYADLHAALRHFAQSFDDEEFVIREAQAAIDSIVQSNQMEAPSAGVAAEGARVECQAVGRETYLAAPERRRKRWLDPWRPAMGWVTAAIVLIGCTIALQLYSGSVKKPLENLARALPDQAEGAVDDNDLGPAQLAGVVGARWAGKSLEMIEGTQYQVGQRLELVEGLAEVCFLSGARVVLQGPAILQIESENTATVSVGRVAATIPKSAAGFTVRTPVGTIASKEAEYGVEVDVDESLLTQVYSGLVELKLSDGESPTPRLELTENQGVEIDAASGRLRQLDEANRLQFVRYLPQREILINLADIVAGGNGLGSGSPDGYHRGVSVSDGSPATEYGAPVVGDGRYHKTRSVNFVDGVFIPNGKRGPIQVDSIGRTFKEFPSTTDDCWGGVVMARRPSLERSLPFMRLEFHGDNYGYVNWLHIASRPEELSPQGYGLIGMHSNCGITFDLHAIRAQYPNKKIVRFRSLVGNLEAKQGDYVADAWVFVDGNLRFSRKAFSREDGPEEIEVPLADGDRFLVLAVTDSGGDTAYDWVGFGDPVIETTTNMGGVAANFPNIDQVSTTRHVSYSRPHDGRGVEQAIDLEIVWVTGRHLFKALLTSLPSLNAFLGSESSAVCVVKSLLCRDGQSLTTRCLL